MVATAQLKITFRETVVAGKAEACLRNWRLQREYPLSSEEGIVLVVSVPGDQLLTRRKWIREQSEVADVEEVR